MSLINRPKEARKYRIGAIVLVAILAIWLARTAWRAYAGTSTSGFVRKAEDLPFARDIVQDLGPTTKLRYSLWVNVSGYVYAVSGRGELLKLEDCAKRNRATIGDASAAEKSMDRLVDWSEIERDFTAADQEASWHSSWGRTTLFTRRSDGAFTLVVVGLEEDRRRALPSSR